VLISSSLTAKLLDTIRGFGPAERGMSLSIVVQDVGIGSLLDHPVWLRVEQSHCFGPFGAAALVAGAFALRRAGRICERA
jgi:hypothetical protein